MNTTANTIIESAFKLLGVLGVGTNLEASEYADALNVLNDMIDSWNLKSLLVYQVTMNTFPFVNGQQVYTLGPGGNFDMTRPNNIERASITYGTSGKTLEIPLEMIDVEGWQNIPVKQTPSSYPTMMYTDTGFPLNSLYFWPIPSDNCSLILYCWEQMPELTDLTSVVSLPPGYYKALKYNLAVELAPMFDRTPSDVVVKIALMSKSDINDINAETPLMFAGNEFCKGSSGMNALRSQGYFVD